MASDTASLPSFRDSVELQKQKFSAKGLNAKDLVALVGGHTIETAACQVFNYRLYNFTAAGGADPTIYATFLSQLRALRPAATEQDGWLWIPAAVTDSTERSANQW